MLFIGHRKCIAPYLSLVTLALDYLTFSQRYYTIDTITTKILFLSKYEHNDYYFFEMRRGVTGHATFTTL